MAREDVNFRVSANVAEAIRMWQAMEEGPKGMADELEKLGQKGKQASSGMAREFEKMVGFWTSITGSILLAKKGLDAYMESQRAAQREIKDATTPVDALSRRFAIQGGLTNAQAAQARTDILSVAQQRGFTPQAAFPAATQLVSSGFSASEVQQGAANEFLKLLNATNATGANVDPVELAKSMTQFLVASKQDLTTENIRSNSLAIQGLFKGTNLQAGGLGLFASKAGKIAEATGLRQELLPLFSQFLDVTSEEVGGTAFQAASVSLATAGAEKQKVAALKMLGLTPEDVDFVGEDFFTVQKRLAQGFASVPQNQGQVAAKRLFGQEGLLAKSVLFSDQGVAETQRRLGMSSSVEAYNRDLGIAEGSLQARANAAESAAAKAFFDSQFADPVTVRSILMRRLKEQGASDFSRHVTGALYDLNQSMGSDAAGALRGALPAQPGAERRQTNRFIESVLNEARASMPSDLNIKIELQDQNANAIPHKSDANLLSDPQ